MSALDTLVLSPHLDDAALSCGGEIAKLTRVGLRVCIVTVFAGDEPAALSSLAREVHTYFDIDGGIVAARREEDRAASVILRAETHHAEIGEAIYRTGPDGNPLYRDLADLFEAPSPDDPAPAQVAALLRTLPGARAVLAPLGVGRHVDHQVVRQAAREVFGGRLLYYEDFPYVQKWLALRRTLGFHSGLEPEMVTLAKADVDERIAAIAAYRSQVASLFGGPDRIALEVRRQVERVGGERRWHHHRED